MKKKKKEQKMVVKLGVWGMGINHGVTHPLEQGGEDLEGMSCFCQDDLELAVGHPGRFTSGRGWVETSACESSEER